jgi:hypothetical protein
MDVGGNEDILGRDELHVSVIRLLDERAPRAEEIQELLGQLRTAVGPETAADATSHD